MNLLKSPIERQSLSAVIEDRLGRAIVAGEFSAGEKLTEPELASRLGVSRAPVREALIGLEFRGLVQFDDRGRSSVPVMTDSDIQEIYLLRLSLEPLAAGKAAEQMTPKIVQLLMQNIEETHAVQTQTELAAVDTAFHGLIFEASGLPRLIQFWKCIRSQIELWLNQMQPRIAPELNQTRERTIQSHSELLRIIQTGDGDRAAALMKDHVVGWTPHLSLTATE